MGSSRTWDELKMCMRIIVWPIKPWVVMMKGLWYHDVHVMQWVWTRYVSTRIVQCCADVRQYNLTYPDKIGCLQCAGFIETMPFTGKESYLPMHLVHVKHCPDYLNNLVHLTADSATRPGLRSATRLSEALSYRKPALSSKFSERAFSYAGPAA